MAKSLSERHGDGKFERYKAKMNNPRLDLLSAEPNICGSPVISFIRLFVCSEHFVESFCSLSGASYILLVMLLKALRSAREALIL